MTKARDLASSGVTLTSTTTTADAALARAGGTMTGNLAMGTNLVDGVDVSARDAVLTDTTTKATAALPKAGGAMTGAITTNSTFDGVDIATRDGILSSTTTTATAALNNANSALSREGGAMTGAITTNSTFDGVDVGARNSVLTSTTTTANAALPKAGGAMTGAITTNSTFDGVDIATRDGVLTTTTAKANVAVRTDGVQVETTSSTWGKVKNTNTSTSAYSELQIKNNADEAIIIGSIGSNYTDSASWAGARYVYNTAGDLYLKSTANLKLFAGGMEIGSNLAMTILANKNVGIGTSAPAQPLHVFKAGSANAGIVPLIKVQTSVNNSTGDGSGIEFHGKYQGNEWGFGKIGGANSGANYGGALEFHTNSGNGSSVSTAFTKKMILGHSGDLLVLSGNVGIKTTAPNEALMVAGAIRSTSNATNFVASAGAVMDFHSDHMRLVATDGSAVGQINLGKDGDLDIVNGNVVFAADHGIKFSAATGQSGRTVASPANTLSDYEFGSWTPTIAGGTCNINSALYVRVGNQVTITFYINNVAPPANTTLFLVAGLPFSVASYAGNYSAIPISYWGAMNLTGVSSFNTGHNGAVNMYLHTSNHTAVGLTNNDIIASGSVSERSFIVGGTYITNQ